MNIIVDGWEEKDWKSVWMKWERKERMMGGLRGGLKEGNVLHRKQNEQPESRRNYIWEASRPKPNAPAKFNDSCVFLYSSFSVRLYLEKFWFASATGTYLEL